MSHRIITRDEWGARYRDGFGSRSLGHLDKVLHHSVTQAPDLEQPFDDDYEAIRQLEAIGQARFGGGISYNFPITPAGLIFEGVSIGRIGAHTSGHNTTAAAICLVGNYQDMKMGPKQEASIVWLLNEGVTRGWWRMNSITWGHRDLKATACPGTHAYARIGYLNNLASLTPVPVSNPIPAPVTPPPAPVRKRNLAQSRATQLAVHASPDTFWGEDTDRRVNLVRAALNGHFPQGVRITQEVVGTRQDGRWGPNSKAMLRRTVAALQAAWGCEPDGSWGPITEAHWQAARAANYKVW